MNTQASPSAATDNPDSITREVRGHVLLIGLNRPGKKNAFDLPMIQGLSSALQALEDDAQLRAAVIFAHGNAFTAGLDLMNVAPALASGAALLPADAVDPWATHGRACRKPVICAVQGLCLTLGIELMLACDIVVAADDARFAQIEVARGIFPFGGGTQRWVSTCGWGQAMRYLLTGDEFDAQTALGLGLVQEVQPLAQLLPRALAIAEAVAAQAPLGVMATLRSARQALTEGPAAAATQLLPELRALMRSEDAIEGMTSFAQRRPARFVGR